MKVRACLTAISLAGAMAFNAIGEDSGRTNAIELSKYSLEELINIEVTSVGKKETKLAHSPAAVAVLTQEDVRRLGATSIPEALRAVPGVQVARISANRWAVTARGFNDEFSNKLLVLVDGRSVYTPTFGGVYWNDQDVVLEDLDRIEVIRGPGASLWGANAVNGVINIITKSARETQGGLVSASYGTEDQPSVSVRYGGQIATNVFYRVYAKYFNRAGFEDARGHGMSDEWDIARGGARMDWEASEENTLTFLGDYYGGTFGEQVGKTATLPVPDYRLIGVDAATRGGNVLGRWTHRFSEESELKLQCYYDHYDRQDPFGGGVLVAEPREFDASQNRVNERRDTWDVDLQHNFALGERNKVIWGLGYRRTQDNVDAGGAEIVVYRNRSFDNLFSGFVQDEVAIVRDRLFLTLGTKLENNDYTGFEVQPEGRLVWTPSEKQTFWGSVARAVRTPTRIDRDAQINIGAIPGNPPVLASAIGDPNAKAEQLLAFEMGYRCEPVRALSVDLVGFYNCYDLLTSVPSGGSVVFGPPLYYHQTYDNEQVDGHTFGSELLVQWHPVDRWRLATGYSWMHSKFTGDPLLSLSHPEQQVSVRSSLELGRGWELNGAAYYVDRVHTLAQNSPAPITVASYVRLDVGLAWRLNDRIELSVWGQNLLDPGHPEFGSYKTPNLAEIPRSFYGKLTLRF